MGDRGRPTLPSAPVQKAGDMLLKEGYSSEVASLFGLSNPPGERTKRRSDKDRKKTKAARKARRTNRKK